MQDSTPGPFHREATQGSQSEGKASKPYPELLTVALCTARSESGGRRSSGGRAHCSVSPEVSACSRAGQLGLGSSFREETRTPSPEGSTQSHPLCVAANFRPFLV